MRTCGPRARISGARIGSIAERQAGAAAQNRKVVDWAGDLAILAGSPSHTHEVVTARHIVHTKSGPILSRVMPQHVPVWTSPAIVLGRVNQDQLRVIVAKVDEIDDTRRARFGLFVVNNGDVDTTGDRYSSHFDTEQQEGRWVESYAVGGWIERHGEPESQLPDYDEINIAMSGMLVRRNAYLEKAETRITALRANWVDVATRAIEQNAQNVHLLDYISHRAA